MAGPSKAGKQLKWLAACACFVAGFEGLSTTAYHDNLANGLPTVCYGETEGVHMGDHYTKVQCLDMLENKLPRYWHEIEPNIHVKISDNEKIAYTSFAYNVGSGAFNKSSFLKKLNAGDHKGACQGLLAYDHTRSAGRVKGLTRRRQAEEKICETIDKDDVPIIVAVPLKPKPPVYVPTPPKPAPVCHGWWIFKWCK